MTDIALNPQIFYALFFLLNGLAFAICGWDKYCAKHRKRRIPERTLFLLAILGGSVGLWFGMYFFHHKTKHQSFVWGIPFILIIQLVMIYILYLQF